MHYEYATEWMLKPIVYMSSSCIAFWINHHITISILFNPSTEVSIFVWVMLHGMRTVLIYVMNILRIESNCIREIDIIALHGE
jgi:hypothetical protein